ncbi:hypothetical protein C1H46_026487 [Malus baccata]|uniref:Uncharacterized protein n=1 Tax=Malus baccata TaxID=106549 RepID=A0A540LNU5_MALBA|nr:hypothetical protein C1H46_026487 [Malus baccata]
MSHAVFRTAQIMPINTQLPTKPKLAVLPTQLRMMERRGLVLKANCLPSPSTSDAVDGDSMAMMERCFAGPSAPGGLGPVMKGQYGAFGAVTLEKGKLDMSQKQSKSSPELFDRKFVDAVLNEWQKTMMDLPAGFRQAYEMGLISSAQMVKFLATNARPTTTRFISRALPDGISRAFIGR